TNAGKVLLKEANFIMGRMKEAKEKTKQADIGLIGSLRIGFLGYAERSLLPPIIRHFRQLYPQIDLHLDQYHHGELIEMINNEELDIGFTLAFGVESMSHLDFMSIFQETIAVVVHEDHPRANDKILKLSELSAEPFIVLNRRESPQGFQQTLQICTNSGFTPNIAHEPKLLQTVLMLVDAGMGVAILPRSAQMLASDTLRFIQLDERQDAYELVVRRY
ncbi:MAG: LysR family substrate-binding domain-containing protein, partial [Bacteroidales bacterium]